MPDPIYSIEIIRRYRDQEAQHAFDRDIQERRPLDLENDLLTLAGGHEATMNHLQIDLLLEAAKHFAEGSAAAVRCGECARQWLRENVGEPG